MSHQEPDPVALADENRRMRRLRWVVNLTIAELYQGANSLDEARAIIERARAAVVALFPDKGEVFDLVIRPRMTRVLLERYAPDRQEPVH